MTEQHRIRIDTGAMTGTSSVAPIDVSRPESTIVSSPFPVSHAVPLNIGQGQAYYWSYQWQLGEQETRRALEEGLGQTFENADDAIRWLLSEDEEEN